MSDPRRMLERLAVGDIDEHVLNHFRLAAYLILRNLNQGKKPGADRALGLVRKRGKPKDDEIDLRDFTICCRLAEARTNGEKLAAVEAELAEHYGISTDRVGVLWSTPTGHPAKHIAQIR